ncbi:MAG: AAA family ATPase [Verrucomicrobiota bacterium]|nr:AAA family ATPase [Verrucomicrobiota bacterium]
MRKDEAIYLRHLSLKPGMAPDTSNFPLSLPFVAQLDLEFRCSVTFLVGENGCGKSTLMEAIAQLCRLPVCGGGRNELSAASGQNPLAPMLRP